MEPYFNDIKDNLLVPDYNNIITCVENILINYNDYSYIDKIIEKQTIFIKNIKMCDVYANYFKKLFK